MLRPACARVRRAQHRRRAGAGPRTRAGLLLAAGLLATATAVSALRRQGRTDRGRPPRLPWPRSSRCAGLNTVAPGEARVVQLFGRYRGTIRQDGLRWVNPFTARTKISTRVRNHETAVLKVNDAYGNPIELAAVMVWKVRDTAQATFEVDDYSDFVAIQTEAAVRHIAIEYPYDSHDEGGPRCAATRRRSPRSSSSNWSARVEAAGVQIIESRFTHLAYAPEIASAMLQRQQAGAVVAARRQIVDGAVGMVEAALARITERDIVELDSERKAAMVSNLLVVLCGDRSPQPVLNTGTLYQ
ncbi:SPFH domain-containing protein [Streptomyces sp. L7]